MQLLTVGTAAAVVRLVPTENIHISGAKPTVHKTYIQGYIYRDSTPRTMYICMYLHMHKEGIQSDTLSA